MIYVLLGLLAILGLIALLNESKLDKVGKITRYVYINSISSELTLITYNDINLIDIESIYTDEVGNFEYLGEL